MTRLHRWLLTILVVVLFIIALVVMVASGIGAFTLFLASAIFGGAAALTLESIWINRK